MPATRLKGKRYPLYEHQALEVVRLVRELSEKGKEQHEILRELENQFPPVIDKSGENAQTEQQQQPTNEQPTTMLATTQKQGEIISRLIGQQTVLIQSQDATLQAYKTQLTEKEELIKRLEIKLHTLEDTANKPHSLDEVVIVEDEKPPEDARKSKRKRRINRKITGKKQDNNRVIAGKSAGNNRKQTANNHNKTTNKKGFWAKLLG